MGPGGNEDYVPVEGLNIPLARLTASVTTAVQCLTEGERRGGHQRKLCSDVCAKFLHNALEKLSLNSQANTRFWAGEDFAERCAGDIVGMEMIP